jgi:hypothetical protein
MILFVRPAPFAKYFYPILPLVTLLVAAGFLALLRNLDQPRNRAMIAMTCLAMGLLFLMVKPGPVDVAHSRYVDRLDTSPGYHDMLAVATSIDDKRGVISRDAIIQQLIPDNALNSIFGLTEADYVTYLSWPSDDAVLAVFDKYDIGWVLLYTNVERWELGFNVWLPEAYGVQPQHYLAIENSPSFARAYSGPVYTLYRRVTAEGDAAGAAAGAEIGSQGGTSNDSE